MGVLGDVLIVFYEATLPLNLEGRKPTQLERNRNFFFAKVFFSFDENGPKIPPAFVCYFLSIKQIVSMNHYQILQFFT